MKLITFTVPCYNSQDYMRNCIESLLPGGEDVEIIIIDDGSTDNTGSIADEYQQAYPSIVRAVHQKNGGYGAGVNNGLAHAEGLYFKIVDSDDYLDQSALFSLISAIKQNISKGCEVDLYITNFVYNHIEDNSIYISHYRKNFPADKVFGWKESKRLYLWHLLLMHALAYRTELLKKAGTHLPEHTFYVDNLYAYQPLLYVKSLYYIDKDLYHYTIGRSDQSVTVENMVNRYDQQIRVMSLMMASHSYEDIQSQCSQLRDHMYHFLHAVMSNTYFFTTQKNEPERKERLKAMWDELYERDPKLYHRMRRMASVVFVSLFSWRFKGYVSLAGYKIVRRNAKLG